MKDKEVLTDHDVWCYTTSKTSARRKVARAASKAHRAKAKLMIKKGQFYDDCPFCFVRVVK